MAVDRRMSARNLEYRLDESEGHPQIFAMNGSRIVGSLSTKPSQKVGGGHQISVAFVSPDAQGTGVGRTMYNLLARHIGYAPSHDDSLSPEGFAFAKSVGGYVPVSSPNFPHWGGQDDVDTHRQTHQMPRVMRSIPIDNNVVQFASSARPPAKAKPSRPALPPELPGEDWSQY